MGFFGTLLTAFWWIVIIAVVAVVLGLRFRRR
jgi:hypothetical protein